MSTETDRIRQAIEALEAQRPTLGDQVTDTAIEPLRAALSQTAAAVDRAPNQEADQDARRDQRKQVTVLFADVSGFTALSETLDAEEVRDLINSLWERLDALIAAHGGFIDKHIGDAVMAVFGVPVSREDDAVRAIRAALGLQTELAAFAQSKVAARADGRPGLAMRVGLHTGPAAIGEVGSTAEYTAIGDTVNTASRLEGLAPVGGVLVSAATLDQVHGLFETQSMAPAKVKGKVEPVHTALVLAERERSFRDPRRDRTQTPLVGRVRELDRLMAAVQDANREASRFGGVAVKAVLVTGEAGIGKSRLLRAFDERLLAMSEPPLVMRGRAEQADRDRPYALIGAALRDLWEAHPTGSGPRSDPAEEAALSFVLGLQSAVSDAQVMSNARHEQERTWSLVSRALERAAGPAPGPDPGPASVPRPIVLMAEDLHWADPTSVTFISFLLRRWSAGALTVVATSRTEVHPDADPVPWEVVPLGPLSDAEARDLALSVFGPNASAEMLDRVGERGNGNPYFVEELSRLVADSGMSRLPGTLTALLQARLDTLERGARRAAEACAVAGDVFWDLAASASHRARDGYADVAPRLPSLADEAVLERRPERDLPIEAMPISDSPAGSSKNALAWSFRHVLFHDVVYEGVLLRERRPMHGAVADWLIANATERHELSAEVADHLDRSDRPLSAAPWRLRAALRALAAYANEEARSQAERGLKAGADPALRFDLRESRRQALSRLGRRDEEAAEVRAMADEAASLGPLHQARAALAEADLAWSTAAYAAAQEAARRAQVLAHQGGALTLEAAALKELGRAAREMGDMDEASRMFSGAEAAFATSGDLPGQANTLVQLGTVAAHRGESAKATGFLTRALAVARAAGDVWDETWALDNLAIVQFESGQLDLAIEAARGSLALAIHGGLLFREALSRSNLAGMLLLTGRAEEAADEAGLAHATSVRIGDEYGGVLATVTHGDARLALGDPAGKVDLKEAYRRARKLGAPYPSSVAARSLAAALLTTPWSPPLDEPEPARALRLAREALRDAGRADDPAGQALARAFEALALAQSGGSPASLARSAARAEEALAGAPDDGSAILARATLGAALGPTPNDHRHAAAAELMARAEAISDPATRKSFLTEVPLHRWLLLPEAGQTPTGRARQTAGRSGQDPAAR